MLQDYPWLGNLYDLGLEKAWVGLISIVISMICGAIIGIERERRDKPAGLRTVILIATGSTIYTIISLLIASDPAHPNADPARLAAQILPGIGFLGAGAILHARGMVVGLTTGATIWTVAAVGVTIGSGHAAAGICFTLLIFFTLDGLDRLDWLFNGRCRIRRTTVVFRSGGGKGFPRIQEVLDRHRVSDRKVEHGRRGEADLTVEIPVCIRHRHHRIVLKELGDVPEVTSIEVEDPISPRS
jgi:putative Mg2+ transporter-C (MgtC) family protein